MRRLVIVALALLGLDVATKLLVVRLLSLHAPLAVVGDLIRLVHVKNYGSAFGLVQGGRLFFIAFSILSIVLIAALARQPRYRSPAFGLSLGLILGGALGNLLDRVIVGAVTDFIDVGIGAHRWPTFNVADIGVTVGVLLLAMLLLRQTDSSSEESGAAETAPSGAALDPPVDRGRVRGVDRPDTPDSGPR